MNTKFECSVERPLRMLLNSELLAPRRPIQTVISDGYAHRGIVREALTRKVDLIVIAKHGHSDHQSQLLGKTAEYVVRFAPCSVLLVGG